MVHALRANLRTWLLLALALAPTFAVAGAGLWFWTERGDEITEFNASLASIEASYELFSVIARLSYAESALHAAALPEAGQDAQDVASASLVDLELAIEQTTPRLAELLPRIVQQGEGEVLAVIADSVDAATASLSRQVVGEPPTTEMRLLGVMARTNAGGLALPYTGNPNVGIGALYDAMVRTIGYHEAFVQSRQSVIDVVLPDNTLALDTIAVDDPVLAAAWNDVVEARRFAPFGSGRLSTDLLPGDLDQMTQAPEPLSEVLRSSSSAGADRAELLLAMNELSTRIIADVDSAHVAIVQDAEAESATLHRQRRLTAVGTGLVSMVGVALLWLTMGEIRARRRVERAHSTAIDQLAEKAHRDPTTGAYNRHRLEGSLADALQRSHDGDHSVVLVYIDLDRFKAINDVWGHHTGDAVLRLASHRLSNLVYLGIPFELTRFGGDEFVMFAEVAGADLDWLAGLGEELVMRLEDPMAIDGRAHAVSASIGIALSAPDSTVDSLLLEADSSLIHAKRNKRGSAVVYDRQLSRTGELVQALPNAFSHGEIRCHLQPVFDLTSGRITHAEVLARWMRPNGETVSPGVFVPLVESFGLSDQLTVAMLRCVVDVLRSPECPRHIRLWINLSPRELEVVDFADRFTAQVVDIGIDPNRLGIEITETAAVRDPVALAVEIGALRARGIGVAIDDFGNGYSPLGYLRELPVHAVKLDRSLVHRIHQDEGNQSLVKGIVGMLASIGVTLTAEGVELPEDRDWLRRHDVISVQGYLLGRPVPPGDLNWHRRLDTATSEVVQTG